MVSASQLRAAAEIRERKMIALRMFRPLPHQDAFFMGLRKETILSGGNRSGKSLCAAIVFASLATGIPVTLSDGRKADLRRDDWGDVPLKLWVVGKDLKHIGQSIHRLLFRAGAFYIIKDLQTGEWRSFNPETDKDRKKEKKPAPPLIVESDIDKWSWEAAGANQFNECHLKNGNSIYAYPSTGDAKQGDPCHVIWIDEELVDGDQYPEYFVRLTDYGGFLFWSTFPRDGLNALDRLLERANSGDKYVAYFRFTMSSNPYLADKDATLAGLSEEELMRRDEGLPGYANREMYPSFSRTTHCAIYNDPELDDELSKELRKRGGLPPKEWTRALVLDPGTVHPAVLFVAIPPPRYGNYIVPYDELYPGRCDAEQLALKIYNKTNLAEKQLFQWFIIDNHAGRQTPLGLGTTVGSLYSTALKKHEISCRETGYSFLPGSDDVESRIGQVRRTMSIGPTGRPQLRVVVKSCPNLCYQLEKYKKQISSDGTVTEKPDKAQQIDLAVCLEYAISRHLKYVPIPAAAYESRPERIPDLHEMIHGPRKSKGKAKSFVVGGGF